MCHRIEAQPVGCGWESCGSCGECGTWGQPAGRSRRAGVSEEGAGVTFSHPHGGCVAGGHAGILPGTQG